MSNLKELRLTIAGHSRGRLVGLFALSLVPAFAAPASAQGCYTWTTIDVPGSTFTAGYDIADNGYISGRYDGSDRRRHGFVLIDGQFQTIDYPGSSPTPTESTPAATSRGCTSMRRASGMVSG